MCRKSLYILIEGDADKDFFNRVVKPMLERKYYSIVLWKYSQKKKEEVNKYLENVKKWGADYVFVTDIDKAQCFPERKRERKEEFESIDAEGKILVVMREIESWYLALLDDDACRKYGINLYSTTDETGKGQFKGLIPRAFKGSSIAFVQDILKNHTTPVSIETARQKNTSFRYFLNRYNL